MQKIIEKIKEHLKHNDKKIEDVKCIYLNTDYDVLFYNYLGKEIDSRIDFSNITNYSHFILKENFTEENYNEFKKDCDCYYSIFYGYIWYKDGNFSISSDREEVGECFFEYIKKPKIPDFLK